LTRDKAGEPYKIGDARFGAWPSDSMQILRVTSVFLIVIAMMLLGADVVSSLEQTGGMVVRSFNHILMLCGFDAGLWFAQNLPPQFADVCISIISWPGWAVIGILGTLLGLVSAGGSDRRPPVPPPPPPIHR
jgi:hypothetical protein